MGLALLYLFFAAVVGSQEHSSSHDEAPHSTDSHPASYAARRAARPDPSEQYTYRTEASEDYQRPAHYYSIPSSNSNESGHYKQHAAADGKQPGHYKTAVVHGGKFAAADREHDRAASVSPTKATIQRLPFGRGAANTDSDSEPLDSEQSVSTSQPVLVNKQSRTMVPRSGRYRNDDDMPLEDNTRYRDNSPSSSLQPPAYNHYQHEDTNKGSSHPRYDDANNAGNDDSGSGGSSYKKGEKQCAQNAQRAQRAHQQVLAQQPCSCKAIAVQAFQK